MKGKEKCKALKEIRHQIALNNDIEYAVSECKHQGECKGTCPKCEAEVLYLERELEKRRALGKKVAVVGLSVGMAAAAAGCTNPVQTYVIDPIVGFFGGGSQDLAGAAEIDPGYVQGEVDYVEMGEPTEMIPEDDSQTVELDGDVAYDPGCEDGNCDNGEDGNCDDGNCEDGNCEDGNCEDGEDGNDEGEMLAGEIEYTP